MEFALVGWPEQEPTLRLDYRAFAYAGKFVVGSTGKTVWRTPDGAPAAPDWKPAEPVPESVDVEGFDDDVVAAVSFSADRTDPSLCRLRYVTVHVARRGEGVGPELVARTVERLSDRGFDSVRIAVNNPFAYEALYKAGFAFTGGETGLAELELQRPVEESAADRDDRDLYQAGLDRYRARNPDDPEATFLAERAGGSPPAKRRTE